MRSWLSRALVLLVCGLTFAGVASAQPATCLPKGPELECTIRRPVVSKPVTDYSNVVFAAGDRVTIEAGGCVQTGGSGKTWNVTSIHKAQTATASFTD
jgi:hypothetical protein